MERRETISTGPPRAQHTAAAREARGAVDKQIDQLLGDVQASINALREVADARVVLLRARIENAVAATKAALATQAQHALERSD
jgi:hypothetical protein